MIILSILLFPLHTFNSIEHGQILATQWIWTYNNERPLTAIDDILLVMKLNAL